MEFGQIRFENNASALLSRGVGVSETVLRLEPGGGGLFPSLSAGQWFPVTVEDAEKRETMRCIARNGDQLTVARGQEGSVARVFGIGSRAELRLTKLTLTAVANDIEAMAREKADKAHTLDGYGIEDGASKAELEPVRILAETALRSPQGRMMRFTF